MIIYLVQFTSGDCECLYEINIKAFVNEQDAIEFEEDLRIRSEAYSEELKELQDEYFSKGNELWKEYRRSFSDKKEYRKKINAFSLENQKNQELLRKSWGLENIPIVRNFKEDDYQIDELELVE